MGFAEKIAEAERDMALRTSGDLPSTSENPDELPPSYIPSADGEPTPAEMKHFKGLLLREIKTKGLADFYPENDPFLDELAALGPQTVRGLMNISELPYLTACDMFKLVLYDIVAYIVNSAEDRLQDLKYDLGFVACAGALCDRDGIQIRAMTTVLSRIMNDASQPLQDHVAKQVDVHLLFDHILDWGNEKTLMGTELEKKILNPLIKSKISDRTFEKPIIVITITDRGPSGEPKSATGRVINDLFQWLDRRGVSSGAVNYMFAQIAPDLEAAAHFHGLCDDKGFGASVDCVSDPESWLDQLWESNPKIKWTRYHWLAKLMIGSIDPNYNTAV